MAPAIDDLYIRVRTWSAVGLFLAVAVLAAMPVELPAQQALAVVTLVLLVALALVEPAEGPMRYFVLLLTLFTSTRYVIWRVTETIPAENPLSLGFALLLFAAEIYGYVILVLSMFLSSDLARRPAKGLPLAPEACPTVDVLIPSYDEAPELLEVTLLAALNLRYPEGRVRVYLLDDGGTVQKRHQADPEKRAAAWDRHERLKALCDRLGAHYLTRERNEHAKAGNINDALRHVSGELVLILDADHVPTRDFLARTVGHFVDDPAVFLVQTPHFFMNPDPVERNLDTFSEMPSENEMFYSVIQRGLDSLNGSFFCGSAAVLRRRCLDEVGGVVGDTITEDAETALELHSRGYRSVFVPHPMVAGLSPEPFSGFIAQRMRWAQGMTQIFLLKNPLLKKGLSPAQRLCYLNSCFFWFFPFARLFFIAGPLSYLLFGIAVYDALAVEFLAYGVPHVIGAVLMSALFYGRTRWLFVSELYELVQSVHCASAIAKVFRNPRAPQFVVTPKGETLSESFRTPLARPFYAMLALVVVGEVVGVARWLADPTARDMVVVLLMWNTFHLLLLLGVLGVLYEQQQRRAMPRLPRNLPVTLEIGDRHMAAETTDVSAGGIGLRVFDPVPAVLNPGSPAVLDASTFGSRFVSRVPMVLTLARPAGDGTWMIGLRFVLDTADQWRAAVMLCYARSAEWETFRVRRTGREGQLGKVAFLVARSVRFAGQHFLSIVGGR